MQQRWHFPFGSPDEFHINETQRRQQMAADALARQHWEGLPQAERDRIQHERGEARRAQAAEAARVAREQASARAEQERRHSERVVAHEHGRGEALRTQHAHLTAELAALPAGPPRKNGGHLIGTFLAGLGVWMAVAFLFQGVTGNDSNDAALPTFFVGEMIAFGVLIELTRRAAAIRGRRERLQRELAETQLALGCGQAGCRSCH